MTLFLASAWCFSCLAATHVMALSDYEVPVFVATSYCESYPVDFTMLSHIDEVT
jgi:hypothetical protein